MRNRLIWRYGVASALVLMVTGCASTRPVAVACPEYRPSPDALAPIQGTGWRPLAERTVEHFRSSEGISSGRSK